MRYLYGDKNVLRALDEAEFWKRQEAEHAALIRAITPGLESHYVDGLNRFESAFREADAQTIAYIEAFTRGGSDPRLMAESASWVAECAEQSGRFVDMLLKLMQKSRALANNELARTVIEHIIREGDYFIGVAESIM